MKTRAPDSLMAMLKEFWETNRGLAKVENWHVG